MKEIKHAIQDDYDDAYAWCYGCGRLNQDGLHLRTGWDGDKTVTIYHPREEHKAIPGFIYGGLVASVVDCHGTGSAAITLHRKNGHEPGDGVNAPRFVTASLHVDYLKPTPAGVPLKAVGTVEEIHPKKFKVLTDVYAGDEKVVTGEVIAAVMPDSFIKE
ncbi:MAG TPA: PaaI family thioesterase [Pseudogracilibacillus sp.]|nr:PaaI family thioesterase [Pseudogracilibacillus sp.]